MNIEKMLRKVGRTVYLSGAYGWRSEKFNALIQPLRYKTKLYLSGERTPLGVNKNDVFLYIGPPRHDLTKLGPSYRINDSDGKKYTVDKTEKIFVGDEAVYVWAVIRKTTEGEI